MLSFPCRISDVPGQGSNAIGFPVEADPCRCGERALIDGDHCVWCGRLPATTIRKTWADRAELVARLGRRNPHISVTSRMPLHGRQAAIDLARL